MGLPIYNSPCLFMCLNFRVLCFVFISGFLASTKLEAQTLTCPDNFVIYLPPNECTGPVDYDSLVWSADFPAEDPVYFPFPGTFLPTGITTITLVVSDGNNNFYTCDFEVNVLAYGSTNFDCPGAVTVSLDDECERMLTATDILGMPFDPCDQDYSVEIQQGNNWVPGVIDANDVGSTFNVLLTNNETGHSCESVVTVSGGEPASITCPPNKLQFCNEPTDTLHTGSPSLTGCFENVNLSYSDDLNFTQCPDTFAYQITRTWHAISPNGSEFTCEQLITGKRFPMNMVVFPPDRNNAESPVVMCNDTLNLTATAHPDNTGWPLVGDYPPDDNVHCKFAVSYIDNISHLCGDAYQIKRVWSVVNLCVPITVRDTQTILVLDEHPPLFEIPDTLYFSNSGGCADSVFLPPVNILTECSSYTMHINCDWGEFSTNGAWIHPDTIPGNYLVEYKLTDACGNDTTQTLILKITNESLVSCPESDTVTCDYYLSVISPAIQIGDFDVLNIHGLPTFYSNCSFDIIQSATASVDGCGNGSVTREIYATNSSDTLNCTQTISVEHLSNFIAQFPSDTSICIPLAQADLPEPSITLLNCELLSPSFMDVIEQSGIPGCYNLYRTWIFIDDCVYADSTTGPDIDLGNRTFQDNGDGYMEFTQTIHVNNNAPITFPNGCVIPDQYLSPNSCVVNMNVPTPEVDGCGDVLNLTVSGSLGTTLGASVGVTPGTVFTVTYKATDECGKMQTCTTSFEVFDTIAPVAVCANGLVVNILPAGYVEVFASDLALGSQDNCPGILDISFNANDLFDITRTFTCDDLGVQNFTIWLTDIQGNQSSCMGTIDIHENFHCSEDPLISGIIENEIGAKIHNVKVKVESLSGFDVSILSNVNGEFGVSVPIGDDYTITPEKDTLPLNGVTTFDLVLIRRHILGIDTLDSPYKMIAADINNSGAITTFDIVEVRKLILVINTEFPNNTSWRFVDASYIFPNPMNPFTEPFPESISVNDVNADLTGLNFIGVKIGDVNNSALTSPFNSPKESLEKSD